MFAIASLLKLYRTALRVSSLEELAAASSDDSEADFVSAFSDLPAARAELERLVNAKGGLESLEGLEKAMDFNESLYGWDEK